MKPIIIFFCLLFFITTAHADQVTMKNGDRLTGTIVKSDGKELVLNTDYAGDLTLKFDAIMGFTSTGNLHIESGGKTVIGPVTTTGDNLVVATTTAGAVPIVKSSVEILRNPAEQAAYEKSLHPGLTEGWNVGFNLGFALTRGNSAAKNLNVGLDSRRKGFRDKLTLYANSIYAANDLPGATPHTTANAFKAGLRYDHDLWQRLFAFGNADFFHDQLQSLRLRTIVGGGLGFHAIKNDTTTLDLLGGVNYTNESYSVPLDPPVPSVKSRSLAAATLGEELQYKLGMSTTLTHDLFFYPDFSDGHYRLTTRFTTVTRVNRWLGWQNSFGDIYVSAPPLGKKKNDLLFSTGVNIAFTH